MYQQGQQEGGREKGRTEQRTMDGSGSVGNDWRKLWHCPISREVRFLGGSIPGLEFFHGICHALSLGKQKQSNDKKRPF